MSKSILCKFFMHGACLKGEHCEFSHDWKDQANNICTFYQRGVCSYGSRCRYDHVKLPRADSILSSAPGSHVGSRVELNPTTMHSGSRVELNPTTMRSGSRVELNPTTMHSGSRVELNPTTMHSGFPLSENNPTWHTDEASALNKPYFHPQRQVWTPDPWDESSTSGIKFATKVLDGAGAHLPICAFAASGKCPHGDKCPHLHGDVCATCGKHCLHPYRVEEREEHIKQCQHNQKRLEALCRSQEIECSVCLERVLSKPTPAERKFGLLSECNHPFCISCIRSWRGNTPTQGMDVNSVLRACPICRKLSHFVIPSVIWYSSPEEKQEIINNYKNKLSSIDCRYFDFGNGTCPFGTSCFYKHAYKDGRLEEVKLRHLGAADGSTVIAKNVRLVDFLESLNM